MAMKSTDLVPESSPSSSRSHSADVVWPPHAYADVGISVDYSGAPVTLHQQHPYERVGEYVAADGRESPLVVYQEVPSPFSQQATSAAAAAAVDAYVQVRQIWLFARTSDYCYWSTYTTCIAVSEFCRVFFACVHGICE